MDLQRDHVQARYGLLALLTIALVGWLIAGPMTMPRTHLLIALALATTYLLLGVSLTIESPRRRRVTAILALLGAAAATIAAIVQEPGSLLARAPVALLLLGISLVLPVLIVRSLLRHGRVDVQVLLGAVSVYVLIGMAIAQLYALIDVIDSTPLFLGPDGPTNGAYRDQVYAAFTTLTTVGYGDLAPANQAARFVSILGALLGQIYLVTAVATTVNLLGSSAIARRQSSASRTDVPS